MASWHRGAVLAALASSAVGCAGVHGVSASPSRDDANVLSEVQLSRFERLNGYEALRRLKPSWLSTRGQAALVAPEREAIRLYVDGVYAGDAAELRLVPVHEIGEIRHLSGPQATLFFGIGHSAGAIMVTTRHGEAPPGFDS
jgi:hypothetical protein